MAHHGGHGQLAEDGSVDIGKELSVGTFLVHCHFDYFVGAQHGVVHGHYGLAVNGAKRGIVPFAVGEAGNLARFQLNVEYRNSALIRCCKPQLLAVGVPGELVDGVVPVSGEVGFYAGRHIEHHQTVFVRLIAVVFHAQPCHFCTVRRECRHGVVAHHAFGEVTFCAVGYIIEVEVAVCAQGIFEAFFLAAGIYQLFAVGSPGKRLRAAERLHGRFEWLVTEDVLEIVDLHTVECAYKGVGYFGYPLVPVFVHEVIDHTSGGFGQVRINVGSVLSVFYVADKHHLLFVGREQEASDTFGHIAYLTAIGAVGVHYPQLHLAVGVSAHKGNLAATGHPYGTAFGLFGGGDAGKSASVDVHYIQVVVRAVLFKVFVRNAEKHTFAVGRNLRVAYTSQGLEGVDVE